MAFDDDLGGEDFEQELDREWRARQRDGSDGMLPGFSDVPATPDEIAELFGDVDEDADPADVREQLKLRHSVLSVEMLEAERKVLIVEQALLRWQHGIALLEAMLR